MMPDVFGIVVVVVVVIIYPVGLFSLLLQVMLPLVVGADLVIYGRNRPTGSVGHNDVRFPVPVWKDDQILYDAKRHSLLSSFSSSSAKEDQSLHPVMRRPEARSSTSGSRSYTNSDSDYLPNHAIRTSPDSAPEVEKTMAESKISSSSDPFEESPQVKNGSFPRARLPQVIIIGVKKGGTRALLEFLKAHPDVRAPGPEIHFFDRHYSKGIEWYRSLMPPTNDDQVTIEKTPSYFVTSSVPSRIHRMSPTVRLILVVRDPVTRAISDYTQAASKRRDLPSFERMAFLEEGRRENSTGGGPVATSWGAVRIGLYARHLERWLRYFPMEQFHFVHGERLIDDPAGQMDLIQRFLGLRPIITKTNFYFNATKGFPCLRKSSSRTGSGNRTGTGNTTENRTGTGSLHCLGKTKGRTHPVVDDRVLRRLRRFFKPFNEKFYRMTGIDFGWT